MKLLQKPLLTISFLLLGSQVFSQSYTNWITGDPNDFQTTDFQAGIVLAGGGTDNDDAMMWMLDRAGGGDVVVIRASNSDGYNDYFFSELGVNVNSVETIRFNNADAANDAYVLQQIENAELLFIAGGDQYDYYQYWKDTPVEDAINYLINEKQITVGGTSAGMAILGDAYYTPSGGSATSEEALNDPFHPDINILGKGNFINAPYLEDLVTDTHYDQRDRAGRHVTFMARIAQVHGVRSFGIACNEVTAVCIDETGLARVFGEYPDYPDFAYFLKTNCQDEFLPELIQGESPLTWNRGNSAVKAYKIPGTVSGSGSFDLTDWENGGNEGSWQNWYVENGDLHQLEDTDGDCASVISSNSEQENLLEISISPNPFQDEVFIKKSPSASGTASIRLFNSLGEVFLSQNNAALPKSLKLKDLNNGVYWLEIDFDGTIGVYKIIRQ